MRDKHTINLENGYLAMFQAEYYRAEEKFQDFHSYHEGYAVLLEELQELWDEIKGDQDTKKMQTEAVQVGAMALRFLMNCVVKKTDGKKS